MSSVALVGPLQVTLPVATDLAPVAVVVLGGGLVGMSIRNMFESIMSEDEEGEAPAADAPEAGGGLMAEEDDGGDGGDDLEGLGGLEEDGDDLGGLDDDGFDDGFGDMDGEDGDLDEFEHRLDEMEAEVGSLSSTVNTVRNENEQISESVAEVEENVRKLLDIYEMVTRGVNPFADDIDGGMGGGGMGDGGGFGLFEDDGGEETQQVDEDIAQADAEGFFDEDLVDDEEDLEADADVGDVLDEGDGEAADEDFEDDFDDDLEDFDDVDDGDEGGGGGGGTSFEDLKEEYESGDAEWADEDGEADGDDEFADFDEDLEDGDGAEADDVAAASAETLEDADDALADDELFDDVIEEDSTDAPEPAETDAQDAEPAPPEDPSDAGAADPAPEPTTEPEATTDAAQTTETPTQTGSDPAAAGEAGTPYLASLPGGYATDLLVIEWLEYLVEEAGVREAAGAIDYYESIDWIDPAVADDLDDYLAGFDGGGNAALTIDHHARSLRYIGELNGGGVDQVAAQRLSHGGGTDGVQR